MEIAWPFSLSPNFLCDWMIGDYINIKTRQCGTHQNRSCSRHNNNEHWFLMQCIDRVYRPCFPYTKFLHHPLHQQIRLNKSLLCMQSVRILFDIKHSMCLLHVIHIIRVQTLGYQIWLGSTTTKIANSIAIICVFLPSFSAVGEMCTHIPVDERVKTSYKQPHGNKKRVLCSVGKRFMLGISCSIITVGSIWKKYI